ncbi:hypothetical protein LCGC14_1800220 [marine sediment metagenome]|uniref:Uncharacterized protein n=1 Tax=marine sediment metagenome TaxID=412755 RepID=A0A0F9GQ01_9ZZZZ
MAKEKNYLVTLDVFFMVHKSVTAKNKKEAIEKAMQETRYGEGEELKVFEIVEEKNGV